VKVKKIIADGAEGGPDERRRRIVITGLGGVRVGFDRRLPYKFSIHDVGFAFPSLPDELIAPGHVFASC
jgi:hypothetical protein